MEKYIEVLDYIENNEREWFECSNRIKVSVHKGLEELANFGLTTENSVPVHVALNAGTTLSSNFTINASLPSITNPHLFRAQAAFLASLQSAAHLAKLKLPLKEKLEF